MKMSNRGYFRALNIVNWRGFFAESFELSEGMTSLSGENGAGKTTIMASMMTALMPDQKILNIKNTTQSGSKAIASGSGLFGRIGEGFAYSVVSFVTTRGNEVHFGVAIDKVSSSESKMNMTMFCIEDMEHHTLLDNFLVQVGENDFEVCNLSDVSKHVASFGGKLKRFNKLADYHHYLFRIGAMPKALGSHSERLQYYKIIESSMYGGISADIQEQLQSYLLPENNTIRNNFAELDETLSRNRMTRNSLRDAQKQMDVFDKVIQGTRRIVTHKYAALAVERKVILQRYVQNRRTKKQLAKRLEDAKSMLLETEEQLKSIELAKDVKEDSLVTLDQDYHDAVKVKSALDDKAKAIRLLEQIEPDLTEAQKVEDDLFETKRRNLDDINKLNSQIRQFDTELADIASRYKGLDDKAQLYRLYQRKLADVRSKLGFDFVYDESASLLKKLEEELSEIEGALNKKASALQVYTKKKDSYYAVVNAVQALRSEDGRSDIEESKHIADSYWLMAPQMEKVGQARQDVKQAHSAFTKAQRYNDSLIEYHQLYSVELTSVEHVNSEHKTVSEGLNIARQELAGSENRIHDYTRRISAIEDKMPDLVNTLSKWTQGKAKLEEYLETSGFSVLEIKSVSTLVTELDNLSKELGTARLNKSNFENELVGINNDLLRFQSNSGGVDANIQEICQEVGGELLAKFFDDLSIEDAEFCEAEYGHLRQAIIVTDIDEAVSKIAEMETLAEDIYLIEGEHDNYEVKQIDSSIVGNFTRVTAGEGVTQVSRITSRGIFGELSRTRMVEELQDQKETILSAKRETEVKISRITKEQGQINNLLSHFSDVVFEPNPEIEIQKLTAEQATLEDSKQDEESNIDKVNARIVQLKARYEATGYLVADQEFFNSDKHQTHYVAMRDTLKKLENYIEFYNANEALIKLVVNEREILNFDITTGESLKDELAQLEQTHSDKLAVLDAIGYLRANEQHNSYSNAEQLLADSEAAQASLNRQREMSESQLQNLYKDSENISEAYTAAIKKRAEIESKCSVQKAIVSEKNSFIEENRKNWELTSDFVKTIRDRQRALKDEIKGLDKRASEANQRLLEHSSKVKALTTSQAEAVSVGKSHRKDGLRLRQGFLTVKHRAQSGDYLEHFIDSQLLLEEVRNLEAVSQTSIGELTSSLYTFKEAGVVNEFEHSKYMNLLKRHTKINKDSQVGEVEPVIINAIFEWTNTFLQRRTHIDSVESEDPFKAVEAMSAKIEVTKAKLEEREQLLGIKSSELVRSIRSAISNERKRLQTQNALLNGVSFGMIKGIRIDTQIHPTHQKLIAVLQDQDSQYQRLFEDDSMSLKEVLGQIFSEVSDSPTGNKASFETQGDLLLDYRRYLNVKIQITRGGGVWEDAQSNNVSTGESIGTGLVLLLMVLESWEKGKGTMKSRPNNIVPGRMLFLDEASRLDDSGNAMINELCNTRGMQMLVAQPQDVQPKQGLIYSLKRYVGNSSSGYSPDNEFVDVSVIDPVIQEKKSKNTAVA